MNDAITNRAKFPAMVAEASARFFDYDRRRRPLPVARRSAVGRGKPLDSPHRPHRPRLYDLDAGSPLAARIGRRRWSSRSRTDCCRPARPARGTRSSAGGAWNWRSIVQDQEHGIPGAARNEVKKVDAEEVVRHGYETHVAAFSRYKLTPKTKDRFRDDVGCRRLRRRDRLLGRVPRRPVGRLRADHYRTSR